MRRPSHTAEERPSGTVLNQSFEAEPGGLVPSPPSDPHQSRWVMRTYAGHSSAEASNALYRRNLQKGQTGLSVAFDLPTQTGYDPGSVLARGEVGRVGVPIAHVGDMRRLFD